MDVVSGLFDRAAEDSGEELGGIKCGKVEGLIPEAIGAFLAFDQLAEGCFGSGDIIEALAFGISAAVLRLPTEIEEVEASVIIGREMGGKLKINSVPMDGESCFAAVYEGGVCRGELEELAAELAFACAEICIGGAGKGCAFVKIVDDAVEGEI